MSGTSSTDIWIAGAFAALSVDLIVFPLDTIKTRIQSREYRQLYVHEATGAVNRAALFRGLYQGLGSIIVTTLPASGAFFTTYEGVKTFLQRWNPPVNPRSSADDGSSGARLVPLAAVHAVASGTAELVSCAILTPAEVIKQNAQMVRAPARGSSQGGGGGGLRESATARTLRRFRSNPAALWRGYGALATRNLPHTALQFPLYERFRASLTGYYQARTKGTNTGAASGRDGGEQLGMLEKAALTAAAGGSAGAIAAVLTTPIDVVKTRIMLNAVSGTVDSHVNAGAEPRGADPGDKQGPGGPEARGTGKGKGTASPGAAAGRTSSSIGIAREIVAEHGWRGLWRGGALRGVWTMLGAGLYLGVYETGKTVLSGTGGSGVEDETV